MGDHDYLKFSVIPSVILDIDIPEDVTDLRYRGKVYVLKDSAFKPMRHSTEVYKL